MISPYFKGVRLGWKFGAMAVLIAEVSVYSASVPTAPTNAGGNGNDYGDIIVGWMAPASNGGDSIISYTATCNPGGETCTTTGPLVCEINDCPIPVMYDTVTVTATNALGTGPASTPFNPVVGILTQSNSEIFYFHSFGSSLFLNLPSISTNSKISIVDLFGREVFSQNVFSGVREITLNTKENSISPGLYIIRLTQSNQGHGSNLIAEEKVLLRQ